MYEYTRVLFFGDDKNRKAKAAMGSQIDWKIKGVVIDE